MSVPAFSFASAAATDRSFVVLDFDGTEALSRLFRFDIRLKLANPTPGEPGLDLDAVLNAGVTLTMHHDGVDYPIHGMLSDFEERQVTTSYTVYEAVLVPRLWRLGLYRTNEVFVRRTGLENNAVSICREVLTAAGLIEGADFDLSGVTGTLLERDYVCQFRESDFDFIARLLEQEGLYFHFDHSGGVDRLVVTDTQSYPALGLDDLVYDAAPVGDAAFDSIRTLSCRTRRIPDAVTVRDYDPEQPSLDVSGTYPAAATGSATEYLYGERSIDATDAQRIAQLRYELMDSGRIRYYGESGVCQFRAGLTMGFSGHPKASYAGQQFLLVEVEHRGRGLDPGSQPGRSPGAATPQYENSFVAVPADKPYRPPLLTPKPRFYGTMTAFVYAEAGSDRAEVDAAGRYRVVLPFDRADGPAANTADPSRKASYWIRMMQTYVGEDAGSYYPLKGGAEVLLSFINGDPDYPVIVGAVPNARSPALLTADTAHIATISTTDLLSIRADGGAHIDLSVDAVEEKSRAQRRIDLDDFSFPKFTGVGETNARTPLLDGSVIDTMTPAEEKNGSILVEREYGNRHQYQDGDTYSWGHRNANVYSFGPSYEETHMDVHPEDLTTLNVLKTTAPDMTDSATFRRADRAAGRQEFTFPYPTGAGGVGPEDDYAIWGVASMSKTWGDVFEYQHGQTYQWAHNSNKTFSYGNGYSEAHVDTSVGTSADSTHQVKSFNSSQGATNIDHWLHTKPSPVLTNKPITQTLHDIGMQGGGHTGLTSHVGNHGTVDFDPKAALVDKTFGTTYDYHNGLDISVHEGLSIVRNYGDTDERTIGDTYVRYVGDTEESFRGHAKRLFWGFSHDFFAGESAELRIGSVNSGQLSNSFSLHGGLKQDIFLGGAFTFALAGTIDVKIGVGLELDLTKIKSNVTDLKAKVNDIEAKVNKLGALTNKVDGCVNNIDQVVNAIAASSTDIAISGLTIIS